MKKLISLALIVCMLFGLASCGTEKYNGEKLEVTVSGNGTKLVKIRVDGEEMASLEKSVSVSTDGAGGAGFVKFTLSKEKPKSITYDLTGFESGAISHCIYLKTSEGKSYAYISMYASVDAELKVTISDVTVGDTAEYTIDEEEIKVPSYSGSDDRIFLSASEGPWSLDSYDETYLTVYDPYINSDGYSVFDMVPVKDGKTAVSVINKDAKKRVDLNYTITPYVDGENTYYGIHIDDYVVSDFTRTETNKSIESHVNYTKKLGELFDNLDVPAFIHINSMVITNSETGEEADLSLDSLPEGMDYANMDIITGEEKAVYEIQKNRTLASICKEFENHGYVDTVEDIVEGELTAKYYQTKTDVAGFGYAAWEKNGLVFELTFMSEKQTRTSNLDTLTKLLKAQQ